MKYVDEFRDRNKAKTLVTEIEGLVAVIAAGRQRPIHIMEVCGGHTHSIFRYGIEGLLPEEIELVRSTFGDPSSTLTPDEEDAWLADLERRTDLLYPDAAASASVSFVPIRVGLPASSR